MIARAPITTIDGFLQAETCPVFTLARLSHSKWQRPTAKFGLHGAKSDRLAHRCDVEGCVHVARRVEVDGSATAATEVDGSTAQRICHPSPLSFRSLSRAPRGSRTHTTDNHKGEFVTRAWCEPLFVTLTLKTNSPCVFIVYAYISLRVCVSNRTTRTDQVSRSPARDSPTQGMVSVDPTTHSVGSNVEDEGSTDRTRPTSHTSERPKD